MITGCEGPIKRVPNSKSHSKYIEADGKPIARECTRCNEMKTLNDFGIDRKSFARARAICKECVLVMNINRTPEQKKLRADYVRDYVQSGKYKPNLLARMVSESRKRARDIDLPDNLTLKQYELMMSHFLGACALSGEVDNLELDHVIPLSIGHGGTIIGNMLPLSRKLNGSKHNRNIFEWFEEYKVKHQLCERRFAEAIKYLSESSDMSVIEYKRYVYKCYDNPINRSV